MKSSESREEVKKKFGLPVKRFLISKYGTIKEACLKLNLNPSLVSQYVSGGKKPNAHFHHVMQQLGFDMSLFTFVEGTFEIEQDNGVLTYNEMKFLYLELKELLREKNEVIKIYERRINEYRGRSG